MISVKKEGVRADEVRFKAQHVLFVEGRNRESIDPKILDELFKNSIRIEPMGPSFSVKSVAQALHNYHPTYYFLIDRDHHEEEFVNQCWDNFPDPATHNLLVWRRREIENYFLDIDYLFQSKYCNVSKEELQRKIIEFTKERLFLDAANHVVTSIREEFKKTWIEVFSSITDFSTKEAALQKLKSAAEFGQHKDNVGQKVSPEELERRFNDFLGTMTAGQEQLTMGTGKWLDMVQGKKILSSVISSGCFKVDSTDGTPLNGREKLNEIVKELLNKAADAQPTDFVALKKVIDARLNG